MSIRGPVGQRQSELCEFVTRSTTLDCVVVLLLRCWSIQQIGDVHRIDHLHLELRYTKASSSAWVAATARCRRCYTNLVLWYRRKIDEE